MADARPRRIPVAAAAAATLAAAVGFGAAPCLREPGQAGLPLPRMAERAVVLPDGRALFVQKHEVSVAEWNACHAAGACALGLPAGNGPGPDGRVDPMPDPMPDALPETLPATGLNHADALQFVAWVSGATGHPFRLPTAAEWSFMARTVLPPEPDPIFTDPALSWASAYVTERAAPRSLKARGSFSTTAEGVVDLDGSVWEWTQDCYAGTGGRPAPDRCPAYFVGGEHVAAMSFLERDPARGGCAVGAPPAHLGLRLVTDVPPDGAS